MSNNSNSFTQELDSFNKEEQSNEDLVDIYFLLSKFTNNTSDDDNLDFIRY